MPELTLNPSDGPPMAHCVMLDPAPIAIERPSRAMLDHSGEAVFASVLRANQLRARISSSASYCDNWTDREPATEFGTFHLIDSGVCWVRGENLPGPVRLASGDLIVFPDGAGHVLSGSPDANTKPESRFTSMLCGEFEFGTGKRNALVNALPGHIVVREQESAMQFRQLAQLMLHEARGGTFGSGAVLDKMADTLFVMAVRHYIEHSSERRGILAALTDPSLAQALEAIHVRPGEDWSVASLANLAHMSRTGFAKHFADTLGCGPIEYLTEWRMSEAKRLLAGPRMSVAAVADALGYQTEAAFRRAFKRITGSAPGEVRRAKPSKGDAS
jgi:AraC-like DNA-binding protein